MLTPFQRDIAFASGSQSMCFPAGWGSPTSAQMAGQDVDWLWAPSAGLSEQPQNPCHKTHVQFRFSEAKAWLTLHGVGPAWCGFCLPPAASILQPHSLSPYGITCVFKLCPTCTLWTLGRLPVLPGEMYCLAWLTSTSSSNITSSCHTPSLTSYHHPGRIIFAISLAPHSYLY